MKDRQSEAFLCSWHNPTPLVCQKVWDSPKVLSICDSNWDNVLYNMAYAWLQFQKKSYRFSSLQSQSSALDWEWITTQYYPGYNWLPVWIHSVSFSYLPKLWFKWTISHNMVSQQQEYCESPMLSLCYWWHSASYFVIYIYPIEHHFPINQIKKGQMGLLWYNGRVESSWFGMQLA